ncbi:heparinase II/III family protein [Streptomyces sp. NPDC046821]|uniref:heparinase II/III family protein n=1 Tax=Streptomyces sp. NPDC046821 TaxID=3154702 RepID=UPI0033C6B35E
MDIDRRTVLRAAVAVTLAASAGGLFAAAPAVAAPVTAEDAFFGVWDTSAAAWTKAPVLDYAGFAGLAKVEQAAKSGDYQAASASLLAYFRTREGRTPPPWVQNNVYTAGQEDLFLDHIWTLGTGEIYHSVLTVPAVEAQITADVSVNAASAYRAGWIGFMLMARHKEASTATFRSRQAASGGPVLAVTLADGTTSDLAPVQDTYIACSTPSTVHGKDSTLLVRDEGAGAYGPETRKAYLTFDLSSLAAPPKAAVLKLTGVSSSGEKDVILFQEKETFDETTRTWNTTVQNTFSWQGDPGGFDWKGPKGSDPEYGYQLPRFYFAGPTADAYKAGKDERIAAGLLALMTDFVQDAEGGYTDGAAGFPRNLDASWRFLNWTYAYDVLRTSSSLTSEINSTLLRAFAAGGVFLSSTTNSNPNWMISIRSAALYLALYFPEFAGSETRVTEAQSYLGERLASSLNSDGGYMEASSGYAMGVATTFSTVASVLKANGRTFTASDGLSTLSWFLADQAYPTVYDPSYGDGGTANWAPRFLELSGLLSDEKLRYVATQGSAGTRPGHTSAVYPVTRTAVQRTGWAADDLYLRFSADKGPHSVRDDLDVTVAGYGRPLLPAMGAFSYSDDAKSNWLRTTSQSRNTVTVDGKAQVLDAAGALDQSSTAWFDLAEGWTDASAAARHHRSVLFVRGRFWLVSDVLTPSDTTEHSYEQTWHFLPDAELSLSADTLRASTAFPNGGNIQVVPVDPAPLTGTLADGYYSSAFYTISDAKYLSYTLQATGAARLDTLLMPLPEGSREGARIQKLATATGASALRVDTGRESGWYLHADASGTERAFGDYVSDARVAYAQESGARQRLLIAGGTTLRYGGELLLGASAELGLVAVELDRPQSTVAVSGLAAGTALEIAAPWARSVTTDGKKARFERGRGVIVVGG